MKILGVLLKKNEELLLISSAVRVSCPLEIKPVHPASSQAAQKFSSLSWCLIFFFYCFFVFGWCRIWRTRCTLLSRGDARCWRISTTPRASAKHQLPFLSPSPCSSPLLLSDLCSPPPPPPTPPLLSFLCALILFCFSELAHLLAPLRAFPLSLPLRCRVTEWHGCNPLALLILVLASCFWLQSVTFHVVSPAGAFHVWLRRGNFEVWSCVKEHTVVFSCQYC